MSNSSTRNKIINDIHSAVDESIKAVILTNPNVITLNFGKIIAMKDYSHTIKVKIVSGGGAGHEPMYSGFVGKGMLTAAIHGDIYSSPPSSDILRLLKELSFNTNKGILLIIQNHSGERLHFGLAAEKAKHETIRVETLIVNDSCYQTKLWKGRPGLSGIVLVQKIAGAISETDVELEEIYNFCQNVVKELRSISVAVEKNSTSIRGLCTCAAKTEIEDGFVEFGISVDGQPGIKKNLKTAKEICAALIEEIISTNVAAPLTLDPDVPVVVLVNNLGSTTKIEELVFVQELLLQLYDKNVKVVRAYYGSFVTALDTAGFSVTFLKVFDNLVLKYLDDPCEVPAWNNVNRFELSAKLNRTICAKNKTVLAPVVIPQIGPKLTGTGSNTLMMVLQFACDALTSCDKYINTVDSESGDGDAGTRIKRGMEAVDFSIRNKKIDLVFPFTFLKTLSAVIERHVEGPLGLIYCILFEAAADVFRTIPDSETISAQIWAKSLTCGAAAVKKFTKTEAGCGTIYDPLYVFVTLLNHGFGLEGVPVMDTVGKAVSATEEAAQKKAPYRKYPDPGACSLAVWVRAVYEGLKCRWIED